MNTAVYLRKSRAEENESAEQTLSRHKQALLEFAACNNLNVIRIFEEVVSGDSLFARPAMLELLEHIASFEAVLCMDIDRLGRGSMREQGIIFDALKDAHVKIITPRKAYDLDQDLDETMTEFQAFFARQELKMIKNRLHRGVLQSLQSGCYLANAPFGYRQIRTNKKPTLAIHPEEAEGVKMIFRMYMDGNGCQTIADALHAHGYRPHRGEKFSRSTVSKILRNPTYKGKIVWNQKTHKRPTKLGERHSVKYNNSEEWLFVDGLHPPIVDEVTWETANHLYKKKYRPPVARANEVSNPLAGVLFCANCGRAMSRQAYRTRENSVPTLLCPTPGCNRSSRLDLVEKAFFNMLGLTLAQMKVTLQATEPIMEDTQKVQLYTQAELSRVQGQLVKLHDLLEQGVYDTQTFLSRRNALQQRAEQLAASLEQCCHNADRSKAEGVTLIPRLENVLEHYWDSSAHERNKLIRAVVKRAVYFKPKENWGGGFDLRIEAFRTDT